MSLQCSSRDTIWLSTSVCGRLCDDKFVKGSDERTKQDIALMTGRIRKWLSMMKRPETGNQMRREKELTQNLPDVGGISELMEDRATSKMEAIIARAVEGPIWKLAWWCIT